MEHWYVLFSKPCREFQVREQLALGGLRAYLPLAPASPATRRRRPQPLFPRYLFARLDLGRVLPDAVRWLPGLVGFVTFGDELATVDDAVIEHIEQRLVQMRQQGFASFQPGQHVVLRTGHPLSALDAVFEKPLSGGKRAQILIDLLGRLTSCEVEMSSLQAAAPV